MLETFSPENLSPGYLSDKSPENISGVKETFPEQLSEGNGIVSGEIPEKLSEGNDNVPGEPPEEFVPEEAPEELSDGNDIVPEGDSFSFSITAPEAGERIDKVLAVRIPGQSRSYLKKLIKEELIRIDGRPVKPSTCVSENETVSVVLPVRMLPDILPEDIPLDVLYEDEDVLVVNKPKGMVVHPAAGHYTGTLVNAVMYHCKGSLSGINGVLRPGIVHRIDKDTTGSIIVCKNDNAHQSIAGQLAEHTIVRRYRAIVLGNIREDTVTMMADRQSLMSGYWSASETIPTSSAAWKPAGPIRSESIWPGTGIPCWVIPCTAAAKKHPLPRRASASTRRFWDLSIPFQEPISKRKHPCRIISIIFLKS